MIASCKLPLHVVGRVYVCCFGSPLSVEFEGVFFFWRLSAEQNSVPQPMSTSTMWKLLISDSRKSLCSIIIFHLEMLELEPAQRERQQAA